MIIHYRSNVVQSTQDFENSQHPLLGFNSQAPVTHASPQDQELYENTSHAPPQDQILYENTSHASPQDQELYENTSHASPQDQELYENTSFEAKPSYIPSNVSTVSSNKYDFIDSIDQTSTTDEHNNNNYEVVDNPS